MASPRPSMSSEIHGIDDMDDISLNSTDHEGDGYQNDDKEWVVEDLYAERPNPDIPGEMEYLIKWEGFPLDECTWEPAAHVGPGLILDWEEAKEKIKAGIRQPFDVETFNEAYREKQERKRRRNAKRKRLGLLPTNDEPLESPTLGDSPTITSRDEPARDEGTQETNNIEPSRIIHEMKTPDVPKQKVSHAVPPEKPRTDTVTTSKANKKKPPQPPTPISSSKSPMKPKEGKRRASSDGKASTTKTGYQGTARKPSGGMSAESPKATKNNASNQKAPASTPKPSSGMPPKITSSLANKFGVKKHTATRTKPQPTAPPTRTKNVFVQGKERKKRAGLNDVMDDPSKAPKAFNSMRVINIAKKRGIERNDIAPPSLDSIPQSFIVTNDRISHPTADHTKATAPAAPSAPPEPPPLVQSPTAISPTSTTGTSSLPKARKSVRFTEAQDVMSEDTPMTEAAANIADRAAGGLGDANHPPESPGPAKAPTPSRRLSLANYQERGQAQVVAKTAVFGKAGSESVRVVFGGIPRQSQPWLSAFVAQETLNFGSVCASYNFIPYKSDLVQEVLATGAVESNSNEIRSTLANIAEHLRQSSYGSHLVTEHFSILVYPSNCDAWSGLDIDKTNSESPLRYMIYRSPIDMRLYPPVSTPRAPARLKDIKIESHCQVLSKSLFGLDFSRFLPQEPREKDKQVFMLLFPRREIQVCNMVKLWLRSCQPDCRIFSNEIQNSWAKFHETVRAGAAGTIILHEDVTVAIRKLPRLSLLFENKRCYTFWDLATGQYGVPRFPSNVDTAIEPGTLQMTRLFSYGRAFLITPSFALSDPVRLCQFLEWFRNYCANPNFLLVACADFPNYLKAITLEKAKEHETIYFSRRDDPRREEMMAELGLTRTDLEARFRSWEILKDIMEKFGDEETSEDIRKVYWITDFIDPNDEQSLVNWFCWWSTLNCDQYRKFTVLGSSNNKNRAAYRNIEIPVYTAETVGDPDVALSLEGERRRTEEATLATEHVKGFSQDPFASPSHANTGSTPATPASRTLSDFKSEIFKNDSAAEIRRYITAIFNHFRIGNWARLHANPVSWLNVQMADHFGDSRCEYDTFKNWVGKAPMFNRSSNTWYGLFYTIDREWDARAPPHTYGRHAWIAAFRPVDPHLPPKTYSKIELFFWDMHACDRVYTGSYLMDIQQKLIDIVKQELPLKDRRFYLEKVHVSSNTNLEFKPSDNPLDVTYRRLQEMMNDGKTWMPPFDNLLLERKWIPLAKSEWNKTTTVGSLDHPLSAQQHEPPPRNYSDEGKMQRSIWHAPRGKLKVQKTKCGNHLYECSIEVRKQNPSYQTMGYQYKSTPDWYHDMKVEGRDASHVNVDSADKILAGLLRKK